MQRLESGKFFGSRVESRHIDGVWTSLARYDDSLLSSAQNHSNDWHAHQNPHFSFILTGGNVEHRKKGSVECLPGKVLFYHSGEPHQNINVVYPSKNFNVEIDEKFLAKYDLSDCSFESVCVADPKIKFTMLRVYKEIFDRNENAELAVHSLILSVISGGEILKKSKDRPVWVKKITEILNDRWDENISLSELSACTGVHPATISKHFPKYFSCTLSEYVRRLRVEKSLFLIKQTNHSLTDIALDCGFADQSHFTRVFKDVTGLLPRSFREI